MLNHPKGGSEAASIPDSLGSYPIHFCDRTPIEIVRQLATNYPEAIGQANKLGDTPLFFAMNELGDCCVGIAICLMLLLTVFFGEI